MNDFLGERRPVHARGFQDLAGDVAEIGVKHPHHDRQVDQRQHDDEAGQRVEQPRVAEQQVDRHQHADRRHHLGGEHPHQDVLGALGRREGHRPGGGNGDQQAEERRAEGDHHRVGEVLEIVRPALHLVVILQRPVEEQEGGRRRDGFAFRLEGGDRGPQDREEDDQADGPADHGESEFAGGRYGARHGIKPPGILPMRRIRKKATILARITAMMPPADAPPTSNCSSAWV